MRFHAERLIHAGRRRLTRSSKVAPAVVSRVRQDGLSYLDEAALVSLYEAVERCEAQGIEGSVIEAGCAEGGSAIVMAAAKRSSRPMFVYDVFGTIPAPSGRDGDDVHQRYDVITRGAAQGLGGRPYYGYQQDLRSEVVDSFARLGVPTHLFCVTLVQGLFEDTLRPGGQVAFAHIDGDWYDSVRIALERILPALAPGGAVVVDDYFAWSGCNDAVNDVCRDLSNDYVVHRWRYPRLRIVRRT